MTGSSRVRSKNRTSANRRIWSTKVLTNPAADILELDTGHLVPTTFVVAQVDGVVTVEVPDGLFELLDD